MPDGDRFERTLRGGGWRSAHKIAAAGGADERVAEKLLGACGSLIDSENSACAVRHMAALQDALKPTTMPMFDSIGPQFPFENLMRELDEIASDYRFGTFAQLCSRTASRCFLEQEDKSPLTGSVLERNFAAKLIEDVLNSNFFASTRDGLALNTGRDAATQLAWERRISALLAPFVENFAKCLKTGRSSRALRIPELHGANRPFDIGRLNEPLRVLGV